MIDIEGLVRNETAEDILNFVAGNENPVSYPYLDRLIGHLRWEYISEGILLHTCVTMIADGVIASGGGMTIVKGAKWDAASYERLKAKYKKA